MIHRGLTPLLVAVAVVAAAAAGAPATTALQTPQLEFPISLVAPGDAVEVGYDTRSVPGATGVLYVRNDLRRVFVQVQLVLRRGRQQLVPNDQVRLLRGLVPARLVAGHRLLYYAVARDPATGKTATVPAGGAAAPESVPVLSSSVRVDLGTHRFGRLRAPDSVVAHARPGQVKFFTPAQGAPFGPQSFLVGRDRSIWLLDELGQRVLVWRTGRPSTVARRIPLPFFAIDFALGPVGSLYVTRPADPHDPPVPGGLPPIRLYRFSAGGTSVWERRLATDIFNTQLRSAPDGTLYWTGPSPSARTERGSERRWTPAATPAGRGLTPAQQDARTAWGRQPLAAGLRLAEVRASGHELRVALLRGSAVVRAWRVTSRTAIAETIEATPDLVGGDPIIVLAATAGSGRAFKWEYVVLRLGRNGVRARFSLSHQAPRAAFGDVVTDVRVGPDGAVYQLGSSPRTGVTISRFRLP